MIGGVILAAGLGQRLGRIKPLLPFKGKPLLQHVIDVARNSKLAHIVLVLGHAHEQVLPVLDTQGLFVVINPDYADGQSSSLQTGLKHSPAAQGIMCLLGDQPYVSTQLINDLIFSFFKNKAQAIMPIYKEQPGNPVILGPKFMDQAMNLHGDTGARPLLQRYAHEVYKLEVSSPIYFKDIDTMEDYTAMMHSNDAQQEPL